MLITDVLLKLWAHSEPGGRIEIDQVAIARMLGLSRAAVNSACATWTWRS
ncbi:hypothetical protein OIE50_03280 [Streptomyces canus]